MILNNIFGYKCLKIKENETILDLSCFATNIDFLITIQYNSNSNTMIYQDRN